MTNTVTGVAHLLVHRVFYPAITLRVQPLAQCLAWYTQQRPVPLPCATLPLHGHGCQAGHIGTTPQSQQQGLYLIISMVRKRY